MRSRQKRRHPSQLALPSRPPHRRLSAHPQPLARRLARARSLLCALGVLCLKEPRQRSRDASVNNKVRISTPNSLGFCMPAEWEPHEATWLGWPHELTDWPGKFAPIPWAFAEIVRHLSQVERVNLLVENAVAEKRVRSILTKSGAHLANVDFFRIPTDRGWMRDSGPICVKNAQGEVAFNNFAFNGWAKYPNHKKDALVVAKANQKLKRRLWLPMHNGRRVVLEGGS